MNSNEVLIFFYIKLTDMHGWCREKEKFGKHENVIVKLDIFLTETSVFNKSYAI